MAGGAGGPEETGGAVVARGETALIFYAALCLVADSPFLVQIKRFAKIKLDESMKITALTLVLVGPYI